MSAPGGLDFESDATRANVTTWNLIEPEVAADILTREFHPYKSPYQPLGPPRQSTCAICQGRMYVMGSTSSSSLLGANREEEHVLGFRVFARVRR